MTVISPVLSSFSLRAKKSQRCVANPILPWYDEATLYGSARDGVLKKKSDSEVGQPSKHDGSTDSCRASNAGGHSTTGGLAARRAGSARRLGAGTARLGLRARAHIVALDDLGFAERVEGTAVEFARRLQVKRTLDLAQIRQIDPGG